ncbi:chemotaxis protein CheA [Evansella tamaricis]|uniref:Chemotaxis protein CheA n=1 Tax=Evansella tamaricis TaxID=2069301 RepID=A0ABS6JNZ9_9BACI|nr:chemotaxis protein CheA [Evansella tamaricis]MBU9714532.1 chemotaxis protein CheA [Evansella tamaricis]
MDKNQYLDMFIDESNEHLQAMNDYLLKLERNPTEESFINEVFRSAHTLKGMAATMGYEDIAHLTHQLENVLDMIRNKTIVVSSELLDIVLSSVEVLERMVHDIENGGDGKGEISFIMKELVKMESGTEVASTEEVSTPKKPFELPNYDDFELTVLSQSIEQGYYAYNIRISLREDCILKAARVFMVFEVLEKLGEVIKAVPSVEQLEEENFDEDFQVTLITREKEETVKGKILTISEITFVEVDLVDVNNLFQSNHPETPQEGGVELEQRENENDQSEVIENKVGKGSGKTIRVNIERLDTLMNLFEELVIDRGRLEQISLEVKSQELTETVEHMSRISGDLQNIILNMRMVPIEQVFNRFPRMVRTLAKELNKEVTLEIIGAETELDRTVIDEIGDPLVHLLRNSIDHGVETREVRQRNNKPPQSKITLKAYHSGNHVFIEVSDDGAGINKEKVLNKAIADGVITKKEKENLTDQQIYELLFASGLSTAEQLSDISGRGVGLDVVKNKIEALGGNVTVDSEIGKGTTFSIQLPLTLSIMSVMLVKVQQECFAIPLTSIIETAIISKSEILTVHNRKVINFRGKVVPLVDLTTFFEVPQTMEQGEFYPVIIVKKGEKMAGLIVNSFIGQQEIVLKSLGNYLINVFAISGATILGNGQVALIIDCNSLIK